MAIDAAETYMEGLGKRLDLVAHQPPITPAPPVVAGSADDH
jgi:hypothetical protein